MTKPPDHRRQPLLDFVYDTYRVERGVTLILDASDTNQLKSMLTKTQNLPEFDLAHLQEAWMVFLKSTKPFDRDQGKPLRFFCSNVNRFMVASNGNANTDAAMEFVRKKLEGTI